MPSIIILSSLITLDFWYAYLKKKIISALTTRAKSILESYNKKTDINYYFTNAFICSCFLNKPCFFCVWRIYAFENKLRLTSFSCRLSTRTYSSRLNLLFYGSYIYLKLIPIKTVAHRKGGLITASSIVSREDLSPPPG